MYVNKIEICKHSSEYKEPILLANKLYAEECNYSYMMDEALEKFEEISGLKIPNDFAIGFKKTGELALENFTMALEIVDVDPGVNGGNK